MKKFFVYVTLILCIVITGISCSSQPPTTSPTQQAPKTTPTPIPSPSPSVTSSSATNTSTLDALVKELKSQPDNKYFMIQHNGYVLVQGLLKLKGDVHNWNLGLTIMNLTNSFIYTSPSYWYIVDAGGEAHQYDSSSYSRWGDKVYPSMKLPPGTDTWGFLYFKNQTEDKPLYLIYNDGLTPMIKMEWIDNPNAD